GWDRRLKPLSSIVREKRWKILVGFKYIRIPYHESAVLDRGHARISMIAIITRSLASEPRSA
ncbi:hypothetical protein ASPBRDRAFT_139099, partial [Aspergillus brasiliensis CBS 101740]